MRISIGRFGLKWRILGGPLVELCRSVGTRMSVFSGFWRAGRAGDMMRHDIVGTWWPADCRLGQCGSPQGGGPSPPTPPTPVLSPPVTAVLRSARSLPSVPACRLPTIEL